MRIDGQYVAPNHHRAQPSYQDFSFSRFFRARATKIEHFFGGFIVGAAVFDALKKGALLAAIL